MNPEAATTKILESGSFGALCVVLLFFIWFLVREQNKKDAEHTAQIERIYATNDAQIEKITAQFTSQIEKMNSQAAIERKESIEAFNKISASLAVLNNSIEKRGRVEFRNEQV